MSRTTVNGLLVAILGALACLACTATTEGPVVSAAPKEDPDFPEVREIELSAIYSTSTQQKLKHVKESLASDSAEVKALESLEDTLGKQKSPPVVAVVRGENIRQAVLASERLVKLTKQPTTPIGPDDKNFSKKCWLFAYISHTHSSPPRWLIHRPTVFGIGIRMSYTEYDGWFTGEGGIVSLDQHPFLYWVPLGEHKDPALLQAELVELTKTVKASFPARQKK